MQGDGEYGTGGRKTNGIPKKKRLVVAERNPQ